MKISINALDMTYDFDLAPGDQIVLQRAGEPTSILLTIPGRKVELWRNINPDGKGGYVETDHSEDESMTRKAANTETVLTYAIAFEVYDGKVSSSAVGEAIIP